MDATLTVNTELTVWQRPSSLIRMFLLFIYLLQLKLPPGQSIQPLPHVTVIKAFHRINLLLDSLSHLCVPNPHLLTSSPSSPPHLLTSSPHPSCCFRLQTVHRGAVALKLQVAAAEGGRAENNKDEEIM